MLKPRILLPTAENEPDATAPPTKRPRAEFSSPTAVPAPVLAEASDLSSFLTGVTPADAQMEIEK